MSRGGRAGHLACLLAILPGCDRVFRFDEHVDAPPEALVTWTSVSAGASHTCGIRSDASLWCWGKNNNGQLGIGTSIPEIVPVRVGSDAWRVVAAGLDYTCGIQTDGSLWCWGDNEEAELGIGNRNPSATPVRVGSETSWRSVAVASSHTCGIRDDDSLWCWGSDARGMLGNGDSGGIVQSPERIEPTTAWSQVAVAIDASCAITTGGLLYCWGRNDDGELGNGQMSPNGAQLAPLQVGTDDGWTAIATRGEIIGVAQSTHVCGVRAGQPYCWGANRAGQTGTGAGKTAVGTPTALALPFTQVAVGGEHTCGIVDDALYCWGRNERGELGIGDDGGGDEAEPRQVPGSWTSVSTGFTHTCAIDRAGALHCTGTNEHGALGDNAGGPRTTPVLIGTGYSELALGSEHACALRGSTLECWGQNRAGQLASAPRAPRRTPSPSYTPTGTIAQIAAGDDHTCVRLGTTGVVQCWGGDDNGSLGNGAGGATFTPTDVTHPLAKTWSLVSTGSHTCATDVDVSNNGWCWGNNANGEVGDGSMTSRQSPVGLGGGGKYTEIVASANHSCGLRTMPVDGEVWCWGSNGSGQLGTGAGSVVVPTPTRDELTGTATLRGSQLALGDAHTCATGIEAAPADRRLFCWGANGRSQLGDGTSSGRSRPVVVGTGYVAVAAARSHSCAIGHAGVLECWGDNSVGQLGDGTYTLKTRPSAVSSTATWKAVAARADYTCGLTTTDELYCWGLNHFGRLGDGTAWRTSFAPVTPP